MRRLLADVTDNIAALLGVLPAEIIYTSGASESNNMAVKGILRAQRHVGRHVISTPLEHPSVSGPVTFLNEQGAEVDMVRIDGDGRIDLDNLRELLRGDTVLVTVTAVDSELGTVQPVDEIAAILKDFPNCRLHVDATQAIGKIPFDFGNADTVTFAPHKFYGQNGTGVLVKKRSLVIEPLIHGGSGLSLSRSGTPAAGLIAGLGEALRLSLGALEERLEAVSELNAYLKAGLRSIPGIRINSPEGAVPHILNISLAGVKGTAIQKKLSDRGIMVSVKSACSTEGTPSRAVLAVSRDRRNALSSFRISLSHLTERREIDALLEALGDISRECGTEAGL